jgi:hypothetical protein
MKTLLLCCSLLAAPALLHANPDVLAAVGRQFGATVQANVLLLRGSGNVSEPTEWTAYSRDTFRPQDLLRIRIQRVDGAWQAEAAGSGSRVLDRAPQRPFDASLLKLRSEAARQEAGKAAVTAKTVFASIDYQLAANPQTGAPEWGLALKDETGYEVGFVVVAADTGAVTFQDWTPRVTTAQRRAAEEGEGERAARAVKRGGRRAWNWTDNARKETGNFFRELFR